MLWKREKLDREIRWVIIITIKNSGKDITLLTKVCIVKAMAFPVVMYGCESWTIKKALHWRFDAFELWCWGRLLRVPWTARRSNQSILKESTLNIHWKYWCWSWSSNYSATWCKEPTRWKRRRCWERLRTKGEGGDRGWDGWMASLTQWTWVWTNSRRWYSIGKPGVLQFIGSQSVRHNLATEQQQRFCFLFFPGWTICPTFYLWADSWLLKCDSFL